MKKYLLVAFAAIGLAGCAANSLEMPTQSSAEPLVPIKEVRAVIAANNKRLWKDPESIRDASISQPYQCPLGGTCVCVEVNARNGFGGRGGLTKHVIRIASGHAEALGEAGAYAKCGYSTPFPEINGRG